MEEEFPFGLVTDAGGYAVNSGGAASVSTSTPTTTTTSAEAEGKGTDGGEEVPPPVEVQGEGCVKCTGSTATERMQEPLPPHIHNRVDCTACQLFAAAAKGELERSTVTFLARGCLARKDVDVDAYDITGATALYIAAAHGHTYMVELLVDEGGADISKATPDDAKSLLVSRRDDDDDDPSPEDEEAEKSLDGGASPLYIASRNGHMDAVRALVQRGADVNQIKAEG